MTHETEALHTSLAEVEAYVQTLKDELRTREEYTTSLIDELDRTRAELRLPRSTPSPSNGSYVGHDGTHIASEAHRWATFSTGATRRAEATEGFSHHRKRRHDAMRTAS